jgi:D-lyxose ketol-isomerase
MDELNKGLSISFAGPRADRALEDFRRQMAAWGLATPPAEPLVLDFGLGEFDRVGLIECWIANEVEASYCGKYLFVFDGQECPAHAHRTKHETFFPIRGSLDVLLDGRRLVLEPGQLLPIAPGHVHSFRGRGNALLLELSMPCQVSDNRFENSRIMEWLGRAANTVEE